MKRYIRQAKKLNYVRTPEGGEPTLRYTVTGFKNPGEWASLDRDEDFTTLKGALKYAGTIADSYYQVMVREVKIYARDFDTEISSSDPIVLFTDGVPSIVEGLKEPYRTNLYNQVSKYIDI